MSPLAWAGPAAAAALGATALSTLASRHHRHFRLRFCRCVPSVPNRMQAVPAPSTHHGIIRCRRRRLRSSQVCVGSCGGTAGWKARRGGSCGRARPNTHFPADEPTGLVCAPAPDAHFAAGYAARAGHGLIHSLGRVPRGTAVSREARRSVQITKEHAHGTRNREHNIIAGSHRPDEIGAGTAQSMIPWPGQKGNTCMGRVRVRHGCTARRRSRSL